MTKPATSWKRYTTAGGFVAAFVGFGTAVTGAAPATAASTSPPPGAPDQSRSRRVDGAADTGTTGEQRTMVVTTGSAAVALTGGPVGDGRQGRRLRPHAVAAVLGMTEGELRAQLASGATLTQVAATTGMSKAALVSALVAAEKASIAADVAAGTLTPAQADTRVARVQARVTAEVGQVRLGRTPATGTSPTSVPALAVA